MSNLTTTLEAAATAALAAYAAAEAAPVGTFLYQSAEQVEVSAQSQPTPVIVCYDYTTSQAAASSKVESAALTLYFADTRPGTSDDDAAHHATTARMERLRRLFLTMLDRGALVQVEGIRATPFSNYTSSELDGVGCQFTLTVPAASLAAVCL